MAFTVACGPDSSNESNTSCFAEPAALVEEYYDRINTMSQSGYTDKTVAQVMMLSAAQATESVRSDVHFFRPAGIRQVGSTLVDTMEVVPSVDRPSFQVSVTLDVSGVSYEQGGDEVTTNTDDTVVEADLELSRTGECLVVSKMDVS